MDQYARQTRREEKKEGWNVTWTQEKKEGYKERGKEKGYKGVGDETRTQEGREKRREETRKTRSQ